MPTPSKCLEVFYNEKGPLCPHIPMAKLFILLKLKTILGNLRYSLLAILYLAKIWFWFLSATLTFFKYYVRGYYYSFSPVQWVLDIRFLWGPKFLPRYSFTVCVNNSSSFLFKMRLCIQRNFALFLIITRSLWQIIPQNNKAKRIVCL